MSQFDRDAVDEITRRRAAGDEAGAAEVERDYEKALAKRDPEEAVARGYDPAGLRKQYGKTGPKGDPPKAESTD